MFSFPPSTAFGKAVPKSRIYTHALPSRRVKELFVSQLAEILWAHKLSPETLRLPATSGVPEIQIFDLTLKGGTLDDDVLHAIDRAVPYPVIHRLRSEQGIAYSAAFKRPSEADSRQWVVGARFTTPFAPSPPEPPPLPIVLDLGHLYAALFAPLLPLPPRPAEPLADHVARCEAHLRLTRQIDQLAAKVRREKQFNRRVALNQQLKPLLAERTALGLGLRQPAAAFPEPACWPGSRCPAEEQPEGSSPTTQPLPLDCGSLLPLSRSQPAGPGADAPPKDSPEGSSPTTQPLPLDCGSLLPLSRSQPAGPEADAPPKDSPEGSSFTSHSPFAAGCEVQSGSRLPHSTP